MTGIRHVTLSNKPKHPMLHMLIKDASTFGWKLDIIGLDQPDMPIGTDVGLGMKIIGLRNHLDTLGNDDVVIFTDAHDVRILATPEQVLKRFLKWNTRILISAEKNCYPHPEIASLYGTHYNPGILYKYVNSGGIIGYVQDLKQIIDEVIADVEYCANDQSILSGLYIKYQDDSLRIRIDTASSIFQNLFIAHNDINSFTLQNTVTGSYPLVWHGNGGTEKGDAFLMNNICKRNDNSHIKEDCDHLWQNHIQFEFKNGFAKRETILKEMIRDIPSYFPAYMELAKFYYSMDLFPVYENLLLSVFMKPTCDNNTRDICVNLQHQHAILNVLSPEYIKRNNAAKAMGMYEQLLSLPYMDSSAINIDAVWLHLTCGEPEKAKQIMLRNQPLKNHLLWTLIQRYTLGNDMEKECVCKKQSPSISGKINVGYLSCNFNQSIYASYFDTIFHSFNRNKFQLYCFYDDNIYDDKTKEWLYLPGINWVDIHQKSNEYVLNIIQSTNLHIMVMTEFPTKNRIELWNDMPVTTLFAFDKAHPPITARLAKTKSQTSNVRIGLMEPDLGKHHPLFRQILKQALLDNPRLTLCIAGKPLQMYNDFPQHRIVWVSNDVNSYGEIDYCIDTYPYHSWLSTGIATQLNIPIIYVENNDISHFRKRLSTLSKPDMCTINISNTFHDITRFENYIATLVTYVDTPPLQIKSSCNALLCPNYLDETTKFKLTTAGVSWVTNNPDVILCNPEDCLDIIENSSVPIITTAVPFLVGKLKALFVSACKIDKLRLVTHDPSVQQHLQQLSVKATYLVPNQSTSIMFEVMTEPSSQHIITGECFLHQMLWKEKVYTLDDSKKIFSFSNRVYIASTDILQQVFDRAINFGKPFIIVTNNSDENITSKHTSYLSHPLLIAWYTQNACITHPKLHCIPIGIANSGWEHGDKKVLVKVIKELSDTSKVYDCYLGSDIKTNQKEREPTRNLTKYFKWQNQKLPYYDYLNLLAKHRYCICPEGAGVDTHRFWECLYLGVIPIVKKNNDWVNFWFDKVPMIVVNNWDEVTPELLSKPQKIPNDWERWTNIRTYIDEIFKMAVS